MSTEEHYSLLIWCGALWDIAEKSNDRYTKKQIEEVRLRIENLCHEKSQLQNIGLFIYDPNQFNIIQK